MITYRVGPFPPRPPFPPWQPGPPERPGQPPQPPRPNPAIQPVQVWAEPGEWPGRLYERLLNQRIVMAHGSLDGESATRLCASPRARACCLMSTDALDGRRSARGAASASRAVVKF